jgi:hypothetical protein
VLRLVAGGADRPVVRRMVRAMTDLLTRLLALAELAVDEALEFEYGDPEDRHIWRELQELKPLVQQALDGTNPANQEDYD